MKYRNFPYVLNISKPLPKSRGKKLSILAQYPKNFAKLIYEYMSIWLEEVVVKRSKAQSPVVCCECQESMSGQRTDQI
jgi:hypothetical protein